MRLAVSSFLVFHLTATATWNLPDSPLKSKLLPAFRPYMLPLGLWQCWWMFAPDPMGDTAVLETEVIDAKGTRHVFEFTKVADLPWWKKLPKFRHPKFTCNLMMQEYAVQREFAARYALRQLNLPPEAYPAREPVLSHHTVAATGTILCRASCAKRLHNLAAYDFVKVDEVRP